MKIYNFNNYQIKNKTYAGSNGSKISIMIDNNLYMLKLPQHATKNSNISCSNSSISEYLGCHIFNFLGIPAQETLLGIYNYHNIDRLAIACKDFEKNGYIFKDFASLKNQVIDSKSNGYGTELTDILKAIEVQTLFDPVALTNYFWDMFVVDAFIGNWDRHNGNCFFI